MDIQKQTQDRNGYYLAQGAGRYLFHCFLYALAFWWIVNLVRNRFDLFLDDSDRNGMQRSGLTIHTDYKTGIEYLSDGKGGLVRRDQK